MSDIKGKFYCKTSTGSYAPRYIHEGVQSAIAEAKRLSNVHQCSVEILKVIGKVEFKEVPVTVKQQVCEMDPGYPPDELPF